MRRWHEDYYKVTLREWKAHRRSHVESNKDGRNRVGLDPQVVDCQCDEQKGRFRKMDAWDCGNTRCWICHRGKFPKRTKCNREIRSDTDFDEQLENLNEGM